MTAPLYQVALCNHCGTAYHAYDPDCMAALAVADGLARFCRRLDERDELKRLAFEDCAPVTPESVLARGMR